jgi:glyoxylase-like metal-dependent hydrolase (beta-lactamase superfamily II)
MKRRLILQGLLAGPILFGQKASTALGKGVFLLPDLGSNSSALASGDGVFLVDSGMAESNGLLLSATRALGPRIAVLFNTHWHFDHTGGNTKAGEAGAKIMAHVNVKLRLSETTTIDFYKRTDRPLAPAGRPVETFTSGGMLRFGGETIVYRHYPAAHTDGDATVHYQNADVYHAGDLFFNGLYPFVDYSTGGNIAGMAAAVEGILQVVGERTRIVAGHGPVGTKADLRAYGEMLGSVRDSIVGLVRAGKTLAEAKAARPTRQWDAKWGKGFFSPDEFVTMIYTGERRGKG